MRLALFDLDNTLLATDSDYEWGQFLAHLGVVDGALQEAKNEEFYAHYKAGTLDIQAFLDFQLAPLARHERAQLDRWHNEFMHSRILPNIRPAARALVEEHRQAGDLMAIVTATNSFVTAPIAREFGIPHLIATIPAQDYRSGRYTGKPSGQPAFREGKVQRVEEWLESLGLWQGSFDTRFFYSDSFNDLPLLSWASRPVAIDPDERLQQHARQHGWPIHSLR